MNCKARPTTQVETIDFCRVNGKFKKRTILLYFCIYIAFLKDFLPLWWVAAHFVCWSVPSMKTWHRKKEHKTHTLNNYHEGIIDRMLSGIAVVFLSFYCNNSCQKREKKTNKIIMRYFYVIVQITSIAHSSMLFFVPGKPFVCVNVVVRSNFVLLCWPFWFSGTSLFIVFVFLFYHFPRIEHLNRSKITQKIPQQNMYRAGISVLHICLCFRVYFLFHLDFFPLFVLWG